MKVLRTHKYYTSLDEAAKVAETLYVQTRGMFACFEGDVWISSSAVYMSTGRHYEVWLVQDNGYTPTKEELWDACQLVGLPWLDR